MVTAVVRMMHARTAACTPLLPREAHVKNVLFEEVHQWFQVRFGRRLVWDSVGAATFFPTKADEFLCPKMVMRFPPFTSIELFPLFTNQPQQSRGNGCLLLFY